MSRDVLAFPKPSTFRSPAYLAFIRAQGCLICRGKADAHHISTSGIAVKGSDYETVPLCRAHHSALHRSGRRMFEERFRVDLAREAYRLLQTYVAALEAA